MKRTLSQEWLKAIACITMLVDHIGVVFFPRILLFRIVGRISFPIFCFLLAEGAVHTRNPKKYALRLLLGAILSEFSYDYLFFGGITFRHQNVMITLLIGFFMLRWMQRGNKLIPLALCMVLGKLLNADYGAWGVALIWIFGMTRTGKYRYLMQGLALACIFLLMSSVKIQLGFLKIPIQLFGLLAWIPILLYSGKKSTHEKWIQWAFYLFYPAHLTILLAIVVITR